MSATVHDDRAAKLREDAADAAREHLRLGRLLNRQIRRRNRLTATIQETRHRFNRASELATETARAAAAAGGAP